MCAAHIKYNKNKLYNNMAFQILYDKATLKSQREMREVVVVGGKVVLFALSVHPMKMLQ